MFQDIEADVYVMVDGDDTYDARVAPELVSRLIDNNLDMVVGKRVETHQAAYRAGHRLGNRVLTGLVRWLFGAQIDDMLSGYRVFSRRFVKSFPSFSREFEIETELTVHSLALRIPSGTVEVGFTDRAEGSESKLRTYRDGWKILNVIMTLTRHERPIYFFGLLASLLTLVSIAMATPVLVEYVETGLVPRIPTLIVASFLVMIASLLLLAGIVVDGTRKARHESSRLAYMRHPAVRGTYVTDPAYYSEATARPVTAVPAPRPG